MSSPADLRSKKLNGITPHGIESFLGSEQNSIAPRFLRIDDAVKQFVPASGPGERPYKAGCQHAVAFTSTNQRFGISVTGYVDWISGDTETGYPSVHVEVESERPRWFTQALVSRQIQRWYLEMARRSRELTRTFGNDKIQRVYRELSARDVPKEGGHTQIGWLNPPWLAKSRLPFLGTAITQATKREPVRAVSR
jgi:hypothetical protein